MWLGGAWLGRVLRVPRGVLICGRGLVAAQKQPVQWQPAGRLSPVPTTLHDLDDDLSTPRYASPPTHPPHPPTCADVVCHAALHEAEARVSHDCVHGVHSTRHHAARLIGGRRGGSKGGTQAGGQVDRSMHVCARHPSTLALPDTPHRLRVTRASSDSVLPLCCLIDAVLLTDE